MTRIELQAKLAVLMYIKKHCEYILDQNLELADEINQAFNTAMLKHIQSLTNQITFTRNQLNKLT